MRARLKQIGINLALMAGSVLVCLLFLELIVFRLVIKPDDVLPNVSINGIVRYLPNTRAVFRHPDGSQSLVTINAQGWNSTKPTYNLARTPGVLRVAVVGDSYVHGGFVDPGQGFPEVMERQLNAAGVRAEVLRFGMDGAPLSQYLNMLRREVLAYKPDLVVVLLIHNDFDESYRFLKTRYASAFMKLDRDQVGHVKEIAPADFKPSGADFLRNFNTFRYVYYETGAVLKLKSVVSRLWWGGNEDYRPEFISSGVDVRKIADHASNRFYAGYVLEQMKELGRQNGFKLAFAMDGVREAVYAGKPGDAYEVYKLNRIARDLTTELGLPFLDLQDTFAAHYARAHQRFEFSFDWHWNVLGNRLAGEAIGRFLRDDARLLGERPTGSSAVPANQPRG